MLKVNGHFLALLGNLNLGVWLHVPFLYLSMVTDISSCVGDVAACWRTRCRSYLLITYLQCQAVIGQHEKRQRQFDKLVDEWKRKVVDLQTELDNSQKESRFNAAEAYKCKTQLDENREVIDAVRRENKNLSG